MNQKLKTTAWIVIAVFVLVSLSFASYLFGQNKILRGDSKREEAQKKEELPNVETASPSVTLRETPVATFTPTVEMKATFTPTPSVTNTATPKPTGLLINPNLKTSIFLKQPTSTPTPTLKKINVDPNVLYRINP